MTDPVVEVIREVNEAVANGDPRVIFDRLHPDVVWEHNIGTGSPEEGVYRGRESVIGLLERIVETWEHIRPEPHHIDRLADDRYRVRGDLRAKHPTSESEIVSSYEQELEFRDRLLVRGEMRTGESSFA